MKVDIVSVHNHGDSKEEYVLLKVKEECDIGRYQLCDSTYTADGAVSNKLRHTYWFPDKEVKKGDLISVWTEDGTNVTKKMPLELQSIDFIGGWRRRFGITMGTALCCSTLLLGSFLKPKGDSPTAQSRKGKC